jgi:hypothetical protein
VQGPCVTFLLYHSVRFVGDQPGSAQGASAGMNLVLVAPFSTPSSAWGGFQSPLIKFQHGDFFTKGGAAVVKVRVIYYFEFW